MSCAIWLKNLGLHPIIIERSNLLGGLQNVNPFHNPWYLGVQGKTGKEFSEQFRQHIQSENISILLGSRIKSICPVEDNFRVVTEEHEIIVQAIVIATGQRVKGYETIESIVANRQLKTSDRLCFNTGAIPLVNGQVVGVVGGGDNALLTVELLAPTAQHIHLFVRSHIRGIEIKQRKLFEYIQAGKVTLHKPATIHRIEGREEQIYITFKENNNLELGLLLDYLYFRMGYAPNTEEIVQLLDTGGVGSLELDSAGYVARDEFLRTSIPKIYAAGNVTNTEHNVATAVAQGTIAAVSVEKDLRSSFLSVFESG